MNTCHDMKVMNTFYPSLVDMTKPFEMRLDDRAYRVGDKCMLREVVRSALPEHDTEVEKPWAKSVAVEYTGRACLREITYILTHALFEPVPKGYVILGLKEILQ